MQTADQGTGTNNAAAGAAKRARRSPEEAQKARLEREEKLAAKQAARAQRLAKEAEEAQQRLKEIEERKAAIAANKPVQREAKEVPTIGENVAKRVQSDLKKSLKEIGAKHGIDFGDLTPRLTQRGQALSLRIVAHAASAGKAVKKAVAATKEATRFLNNYKLVGIKPSLLGKEVQLAGEEGSFKVLGMKGSKNDIVLQQVGGNEETKTVSADEFKTKMVAAA